MVELAIAPLDVDVTAARLAGGDEEASLESSPAPPAVQPAHPGAQRPEPDSARPPLLQWKHAGSNTTVHRVGDLVEMRIDLLCELIEVRPLFAELRRLMSRLQ